MCDDELAEVTVPQIWAGVDIGKEHHHCVVVDERGERLLSRRVFNDESVLLELIADVLALSEDTLWAVYRSTSSSVTPPQVHPTVPSNWSACSRRLHRAQSQPFSWGPVRVSRSGSSMPGSREGCGQVVIGAAPRARPRPH
ncbi:hypothetical protein ADL28_28785 [Streptomyces violaceusniger]|uniref:Transposase IS110-like N-terminal domain-containing protein n=1 Tax=Streptomyces violaceusniger TaxID=68280 RepID=A0A0X3VYA8_STRVO|nr:hypothetical protein ADL28_28785 [Streptomyces violaceusniger]